MPDDVLGEVLWSVGTFPRDSAILLPVIHRSFIQMIKECDHHFPRMKEGGMNVCEFCGKEKVMRFFSLDGFYNEEAFLLGQDASFEDKNPFEKNTNSWFNWNKGKNTNNE